MVTLWTAIVVALHFADPGQRAAALNGQFFEDSKNSSPFLVLLLAAPLVWFAGGRRRDRPTVPLAAPSRPRLIWDIGIAIVFVATGTFSSLWFASPFAGLPPAIHD